MQHKNNKLGRRFLALPVIEKKEHVVLMLRRARISKNISQVELARRMRTTSTAIARLESIKNIDNHTQRLKTLESYAKAIGCELNISVEEARL
jgi:transcriptional regulator with XRE-family HTH domain